jgi:hypothetical protein
MNHLAVEIIQHFRSRGIPSYAKYVRRLSDRIFQLEQAQRWRIESVVIGLKVQKRPCRMLQLKLEAVEQLTWNASWKERCTINASLHFFVPLLRQA